MIPLLTVFALLLPALVVVFTYLLGAPTGGAVTEVVWRSLRRVAPAAGLFQHPQSIKTVGGHHGEEY